MGSTELGVGVLLLIASMLVAAVWGRDQFGDAAGKGASDAPQVSAPAAAPPGEPLTR